MKTTKARVRADFAHARNLMRIADTMLSDKTITDFSEGSEFGQVALELSASVATLIQYLSEQDNQK